MCGVYCLQLNIEFSLVFVLYLYLLFPCYAYVGCKHMLNALLPDKTHNKIDQIRHATFEIKSEIVKPKCLCIWVH